MATSKRKRTFGLGSAVFLSLSFAIGGAGICCALMMKAIATFGWLGWVLGLTYAGGITGIVIFGKLVGKEVSIWDPSVLALTAGLLILRVVEGTHEVADLREKQRVTLAADLAACESTVRSARKIKAANYRGNAPTARGREWDAEEKTALADCRQRFPVPTAAGHNALAELGPLDWFLIVGPCVLDFALIVAAKRFASYSVEYALRNQAADQPPIHPSLKAVDLDQLPKEIVDALDPVAGTYKGQSLGKPAWRRVRGGRVMWPTLAGLSVPNGGAAFVGGQRIAEKTEKTEGPETETTERRPARQALGASFRPPEPATRKSHPLIPMKSSQETDDHLPESTPQQDDESAHTTAPARV